MLGWYLLTATWLHSTLFGGFLSLKDSFALLGAVETTIFVPKSQFLMATFDPNLLFTWIDSLSGIDRLNFDVTS